MSDVSVVASSVTPANASTNIVRAIAGATVSAGQAVYADPAANFSIKPAQATNSVQAMNVSGIALANAAAGQPMSYASSGDVQFSNLPLMAAGVYVLSGANPGGLAPVSDLVSGNYVTLMGVSISPGVLRLGITASNGMNASGNMGWNPLDNVTCQGRLTGVSGQPAADTAAAGSSTVYFTPYRGNKIATYSGTSWSISTFTEQSLSVTGLIANTVYDIFISDGTLALSAVAWTNSTTRATALVLQDNVYVLTGTLTKRYLGTIYTQNPGAGVVLVDYPGASGVAAQRFIWNMYNRAGRSIVNASVSGYWAAPTSGAGAGSYRQSNNEAAQSVKVVIGLDPTLEATNIDISHTVAVNSGSVFGHFYHGFGLDTTSAVIPSSVAITLPINGGNQFAAHTHRLVYEVPLGFHAFNVLENNGDSVVAGWEGTPYSGVSGTITM